MATTQPSPPFDDASLDALTGDTKSSEASSVPFRRLQKRLSERILAGELIGHLDIGGTPTTFGFAFVDIGDLPRNRRNVHVDASGPHTPGNHAVAAALSEDPDAVGVAQGAQRTGPRVSAHGAPGARHDERHRVAHQPASHTA
jgi:hypothetical protein